MPLESERDRFLKSFFKDSHRDDDPLPFGEMWTAAKRRVEAGQAREHRRAWSSRWAFLGAGAVALLLLIPLVRAPAERRQVVDKSLSDTVFVEQVAVWRGPLDFLLETPGRELLGSVPDLDGVVPAPAFDQKL